jgi:hypothetical protein
VVAAIEQPEGNIVVSESSKSCVEKGHHPNERKVSRINQKSPPVQGTVGPIAK